MIFLILFLIIFRDFYENNHFSYNYVFKDFKWECGGEKKKKKSEKPQKQKNKKQKQKAKQNKTKKMCKWINK